MDNNNNKQIKQENSSLLDHDSSPKKPPLAVVGGGGGGGDRLKRDEWSEGAVTSLLEAYEAKWVLRNRAKLKGHDWEDVARYVSSRANSPKTQTQCKNKIESMKKRYRSESAGSDVSSWPLFHRLDLLLRGTSGPSSSVNNPPLVVVEHAPQPAPPQLHSPASLPVQAPAPAPAPAPTGAAAQNSIDFNGVDRENKKNAMDTKLGSHQEEEKMEIETDSSTPALYSNEKQKMECKNEKKSKVVENDNKKKRRIRDIGESIEWLGKVVVSTEKTRNETMREIEKMRADAEVKRGEFDLKRTEIIANTQLEIARLFAKAIDPSFRIARN